MADTRHRNMIRVFLVDDHEIVRRGLTALLETSGHLSVVGDAGDYTSAVTLFTTIADQIDVAVLDIRLPDGSGVELCRELRDIKPELNCLMLTSFADDEAFDAALTAGAKGYVLKDVRSNDLVAAIHKVATGDSLFDPETVERARGRMMRRTKELELIERLSAQELRILQLLTEGLTNREIAEAMFLAEKTVKNYVSNLLAKLGFQRRTEAALYGQKHLQQEHQYRDTT
ncbi:MAG: response regulator transcription factor, partial [Actinomycetes bacterium]